MDFLSFVSNIRQVCDAYNLEIIYEEGSEEGSNMEEGSNTPISSRFEGSEKGSSSHSDDSSSDTNPDSITDTNPDSSNG